MDLKRIFYITSLIISASLVTPVAAKEEHISHKVQLSNDVSNTFVLSRQDTTISTEGDSIKADELIILHTDSDLYSEVSDSLDESNMDDLLNSVQDKSNLGSLSIYKSEDSDMLHYKYEGVAGSTIGDATYCDYNSYYEIHESAQIRYILYLPENKNVIYIKFYHKDNSIHDSLRIEYRKVGTSSQWLIDSFDCDKVNTPSEAEIAARFSFWDECEYKIATTSGSLNIRNAPGGEVIKRLEKDTEVTLYRHQQPSSDGTLFSLIAKYSAPDEEGYCYPEYFGWAATEYLEEMSNSSWILNGGKANDLAWSKWEDIYLSLTSKQPESEIDETEKDTEKIPETESTQ